jgi:hypothetical protein
MEQKHDDYQTTRIWKMTHKRLRLIAAMTGESIVQVMERLTQQELVRLQQQETARPSISTQHDAHLSESRERTC